MAVSIFGSNRRTWASMDGARRRYMRIIKPKPGNWSATNAKNAKQIRVLQPLQVSPGGRALCPA